MSYTVRAHALNIATDDGLVIVHRGAVLEDVDQEQLDALVRMGLVEEVPDPDQPQDAPQDAQDAPQVHPETVETQVEEAAQEDASQVPTDEAPEALDPGAGDTDTSTVTS